jgi:hypothetical protein
MSSDTDKIVDFRLYRERHKRVPRRSFAHSSAAPTPPLFFPVPFPFLVPVPILWFPYWVRQTP